MAHADVASMESSQIDAVSGATPTTGSYSYVWDETDDEGNKVPKGTYTFYVEGTLYWSSIVVFQGEVDTGGTENTQLDVETSYTENTETNRNMLSNVTAEYIIKNE